MVTGFFQTSRKRSTHLASFQQNVILGRTYQLVDGRIGVVRFIGKTTFRPGIEWFGLELTQGDGNNNGTVQGLSYFSCAKGKGVFVQLNKFGAPCSARKGHAVPRVDRKPGPRETGRNDKYKAAKFDIDTESGSFLKEKNAKVSSASTVPRKLGPRETGRIDYDAANFVEGETGESFLKEKCLKTKSTGHVKRKMGPREIGRIDYDAANYQSGGASSDSFLKEKVPAGGVSSRAKKSVAKKQGPREIGRNDYDAATYE